MGFKVCKLLIVFFLFWSCDEPTKVNKPFPPILLKPFKIMDMEKQTSSYIHKMENTNSGVSVYIAWEKITDTFFSHYNLYIEKEGEFELLIGNISLSNDRVLVEGLKYDKQLKFALTIVKGSGEESSITNSNHISLYPTKGFPSEYIPTKLDSLNQNFALQWRTTVDARNPLINTEDPRVFDSVSVNVFYFDSEEDKSIKMFSLISDYDNLLVEDDGEQGNTRNYVVNFDSIMTNYNTYERFDIDPTGLYNTSSFFSKKGSYSFYFQLYKKEIRDTYVFKTEIFSLTID